MAIPVENRPTYPGQNIYSVKDTKIKKIVGVGFDNKMDAKDKRNELSKDVWAAWEKKCKDHPNTSKPLPYIVVKGADHPIYKTYTNFVC